MKNIPLTHENQDYLFYIMDSSSKMQMNTNEKQIEKMKQSLKIAMEVGLTERQKLLIEKYYFEGKTMREIGEELGIAKSTVSLTIKRAKEKLEKIKNII
ncbi:RNA polymerase sigma factor (sigma-70 family) [Anaerosolibacter carboniphilus]|uniref:RNA polymerase sigma factor (Sigma-70 family) n=1 Tax=Anaerosolibacter carboniphilus TaxID=1417629 RepID=A0A841KZ89_9FIRM|nr:RNA polymerase sigma factor (sigma-70 family) [Anaerosolibacter carboniphilus]